ncbi:MAG: hypothetical protein WD398_13160 [Cyclobacteriaceae bacterium]
MSQIRHPKFGLGVMVEMDASFYKIYFLPIGETKNIPRDFPNFELVEKKEGDGVRVKRNDFLSGFLLGQVPQQESDPIIK